MWLLSLFGAGVVLVAVVAGVVLVSVVVVVYLFVAVVARRFLKCVGVLLPLCVGFHRKRWEVRIPIER